MLYESSGQILISFSKKGELLRTILTNKVTISTTFNTSSPHSFLEDPELWLTDKRYDRIVAVSGAFEEAINIEKPHNLPNMCDVSVAEEPQLDLGPVNVLEQLTKLWVGFDQTLEWDGVVDHAVEFHRIYIVVTD